MYQRAERRIVRFPPFLRPATQANRALDEDQVETRKQKRFTTLAETQNSPVQIIETWGAFHYAKPTGQRSVGISEQNGTAFSD